MLSRILKPEAFSEKLVSAFAILIPWQIYFRLYGQVDLPLSLFVSFAGFAIAIAGTGSIKALFKFKGLVSGYVLLLLGIAMASLFRAPDNLYEAANVLGRLGTGMLVILWMGLLLNSASKRFPLRREKVIKAFLVSAFPLGVVGSILLFVPYMEGAWVNMVSGVLIEPNSSTIHNNILALDKIGVIFTNTNVGAVFWGMSMWLALWMRERSWGIPRFGWTIFSVIFCADVMVSGSRAGALALVVSIVLSFVVRFLYSSRNDRAKRETLKNAAIILTAVFFVFCVDIGLEGKVLMSTIDRTVQQVEKKKVESRPSLWKHSLGVIREAPVLGHGVVNLRKIGFPRGLPPHNIVFQIWIYGGLASLAGLIWLLGAVLVGLFRQLSHDHDIWLPIVLLSWLIIQSMFTNLLIGNFRIAMLFWLVVSMFLWPPGQTEDEEAL